MTIDNFRSHEPLYIVMVKINDAEQVLRTWAKQARVQASIEGPRIKFFDQRSMDIFSVSCPADWSQVVIWDCWNKRHIYNQ